MNSTRFTIGMILLFTNQIFGWSGILFFGYLARKTGNKIYYLFGGAIYAVSWGMLFLGAYLAGPEGLVLVRRYIPDWLSVAGVAVFIFVFLILIFRRKNNKITA